MKRTPVSPDLEQFPDQLRPIIAGAPLYDSSCSPEAHVYYIERDQGLFLKTAPKGTLQAEADLTGFFHQKGLSAQVVAYLQRDRDWLLTQRLPGEDCLHPQYLEDPRRLSETLGTQLRLLHETDPTGCPVPNRTESYLATASRNYRAGRFDPFYLPEGLHCPTPEAAWAVVKEAAPYLKADTLLHGDYCLPNVLLKQWQFSGFVDLGGAGVGDRHIDLFWGIWSLNYNLKTDAYRDRFLDAYGRELVTPELLDAIGAFEAFG